MSLQAGTRLGPYEIIAPLGAGGMGEVYRARDAKLHRDVAIKVLPELRVSDPPSRARLEREALALAALNHPHIAHIYGAQENGDTFGLVMELVEGPTLADLIADSRGGRGLLVEDAIRIARQVADALDAAHAAGIIHRDLKPANIKVRPDGVVKVLDFGLARMADPSGSGAIAADSPTEISPVVTAHGVILGTAAYMAPEQARGKPLDKRADIWAFGCLLYEMLTGRPAFSGDTLSDTIAAVLGRASDWQLLPPTTPPGIHRLLRRCLEKDPRRRLHDIADARIELDDGLDATSDAASMSSAPRAAGTGPRSARERQAWLTAAACLVALIGVLVFGRLGRDPAPPDASTYSVSILLPDGLHFTASNRAGRFAVSPDGRRLAIAAADGGGHPMLWVRPLDSRVVQPLVGTEGAASPFWSPDSRFIAFFANGKLRTIDAAGGQVTTICDSSFSARGSWNRDDVILFTPAGNSSLFRVSSSPGMPTPVTTLDAANGDVQHSYPFFLPDGNHFLYFVVGSKPGGMTDPRGIYAGALDSKEPPKLLVRDGSNAMYANGHLFFLRGGTLLGQAFDLNRLELRGQPVSVVEAVQTAVGASTEVAAAFTVSQTGVLAYQTGSIVRSQLAWFDRTGRPIASLGDLADYSDVSLSPDDSRVAVSVRDPNLGTRDLWIFDLSRGLRERFTSDAGDDFGPNWLRPGGDRIVFSSRREDGTHLYQKRASGTTSEEPLLKDSLGKFNASSSGDGRYLVYVAGGGIIARSDIWVLPMFGDRKPTPFLEEPVIETQGQFSPDGRWLAYTLRDTGQLGTGHFEVYVTPFPDKSDKWRISTAGGSLPRWNRNGKEIFYLAPDNTLVATPVNGQTSRFEVGTGRALFKMNPRPIVQLDSFPYDVTRDGQRFLVNTFVEDSASAAITLLVNWRGGQSK